ncbi:hypothetical protein CBM2599_P190011 [Cupriavidus taiwanensis]|uniref:Uncharacterized protein n=1 Tax=Cupriavidus taiwanensis TaxID=164546 RepID=A0A375CMF3_9BURK|nr:hypothetical protein CBM2589_P190013 [Cupriavidus taiwanensis]SOZ06825.1 hypothetical protein CBM2599_P190011 [Cupriavidus taiwanensis]SOZ19772.1 hypothetical protein CBM2595_P190011 [Cupriavidus taiwanensis]SOZ75756.1 hypothetical protein CBM2617_P200012 [Cupriavidus taiwanensis]SPA21538.1 hypothetical protein CBM2631_P230012 [Cupriavidus taiwanensis]
MSIQGRDEAIPTSEQHLKIEPYSGNAFCCWERTSIRGISQRSTFDRRGETMEHTYALLLPRTIRVSTMVDVELHEDKVQPLAELRANLLHQADLLEAQFFM